MSNYIQHVAEKDYTIYYEIDAIAHCFVAFVIRFDKETGPQVDKLSFATKDELTSYLDGCFSVCVMIGEKVVHLLTLAGYDKAKKNEVRLKIEKHDWWHYLDIDTAVRALLS